MQPKTIFIFILFVIFMNIFFYYLFQNLSIIEPYKSILSLAVPGGIDILSAILLWNIK